MKRIDKIITKLVLLVLFTTSNISVYAQTEEDIKLPDVFPTEDAVWIISKKAEYYHGTPYEYSWKESYYLLGDTIIENKKYSKLYSLEGTLDSLKVKSCNFYTENQLYVGAIRVEGEQVYLRPHEVIYHADGKICPHILGIDYNGYPYYKNEDIDYSFFEKDILMYDFSVEVSERLYIDNYPLSITNNSTWCLHFLATGIVKGVGEPHSWIKGIGSTGGLWFNFDEPNMETDEWISHNLHSFHYKGKQFYPTEESGINESIADTPKTKAYVSDGVLYIENAEGVNTVTVYDAMGRVISSGTYNNSSVQISLPSTLKGVIMVKVNNEVVKVVIKKHL